MDNIIGTIVALLTFIGIAVITVLLNALIVMLLWNWIAVGVLGLININIWQALGIMILFKVLTYTPTYKRSK